MSSLLCKRPFLHRGTRPGGRGNILITTNKGIKDWPGILAGDEVLVTAILDRLPHTSDALSIKCRSYRLRDLEHAVALQAGARA